jgi:hypothetical protein
LGGFDLWLYAALKREHLHLWRLALHRPASPTRRDWPLGGGSDQVHGEIGGDSEINTRDLGANNLSESERDRRSKWLVVIRRSGREDDLRARVGASGLIDELDGDIAAHRLRLCRDLDPLDLYP